MTGAAITLIVALIIWAASYKSSKAFDEKTHLQEKVRYQATRNSKDQKQALALLPGHMKTE